MAEVQKPPWVPEGLYQVWLDAFIGAGGTGAGQEAEVRALETMRNDPTYDTYFPGIRREDGSIRFGANAEQTYYSNIQSFRNTVEGAGLNPDVFSEEYAQLIEGDTSPSEFTSRVNALESRVLSQGPGIRDFYAANYGLDMTSEGVLAGLMSDRVNDSVLSRQITMAEIAGEGTSRGFDIGAEFAEMLATTGDMDRAQAQRLFGSAERMLPMLNQLAARHGNAADPFDIMDFAGAEVLDDPEQLRAIEMTLAQEAATFTGGAQVDIARSRQHGGVTGLLDV